MPVVWQSRVEAAEGKLRAERAEAHKSEWRLGERAKNAER